MQGKEDAEKKFFKQAEKSPMMKDAMRRDMLDVVYVGLKESLMKQCQKIWLRRFCPCKKDNRFLR